MSLTGAIYTGLSGLNAFSDGLQIISNNVSNLDTNGYKAETVNFNDLYNGTGEGGQPYLGPEGPDTGEGVTVAPAGSDFSQGTLQQTGKPLDLAVNGTGFLVLQENGQTYYTRTGSFSVGADGGVELSGTPTGTSYQLTTLNAQNQPKPVNINAESTSPPSATTTVTLGDNLSSQATTASVSNVTVYDSEGSSQSWTITATPASSSGGSGSSTTGDTTWNVVVTDGSGATIGSGTIGFTGGQIDPSASKITVTNTPTDGAAPLSVTLDFSAVTSFAAGSTSTLQTTKVDGQASGSLTNVSVDQNGNLVLSYSNSATKSLGAVALADFETPDLLTNTGDGLYQNKAGVSPQLLGSGGSQAGTVVSGELEASNVNLTQEFGDLILIQRGYQASSEVVSASNDMIQQLFGIRGQAG